MTDLSPERLREVAEQATMWLPYGQMTTDPAFVLGLIGECEGLRREAGETVPVPDDPWRVFAWFMNRCASGFGDELMRGGKTETQARNTVVRCFLQMAAGEACRIARTAGREPDPEKWKEATTDAFDRAFRYTARATLTLPEAT